MAKNALKTMYICRECGAKFPKWNGKCTECSEWNTLEEEVVSAKPVKSTLLLASGIKIIPLNSENSENSDEEPEVRFDTGTGELNRILGGGLVKGSLVLISGDPGIGKSTLLLQLCGNMAKKRTILYVSGEESVKQIRLRASRLGVKAEKLLVVSSTVMDGIINGVKSM
jgi:DNA repair protein RadA/Sms